MKRIAIATLAVSLLGPAGNALAVTAIWVGLGTTNLWSDPLNWSPAGLPPEASDLLFGQQRPFASSVLDVTRSFATLTFAADAGAFDLHVRGSAGVVLELAAAGLRNLTAGSGPSRQALIADAGVTGGLLRFSGSAGVNLGLGQDARAVELTAAGAALAGQSGGHLAFLGQSSIGTDTFDVLRVQGSFAGGAAGAELGFRGEALAGRYSTVVVSGGAAAGASGGSASFSEDSRAAGTITVLAGVSDGLGGRVEFLGGAVLATTAALSHEGARSIAAGSEAATSLRGDAVMVGSAVNGAATLNGARGGRLEFFDRARHDTTGIDPSLGIFSIVNAGASVPGAGSGQLVFHDDSAVVGSRLFILNATSEGSTVGTAGGGTVFMDRSRAGAVSIDNAGTGGAGAFGGSTRFVDRSSAEVSTLVMRGGSAADAAGGNLYFGDDATAGSAQIRNEGGSTAGALGGSTRFTGRSTANAADIVNRGGGDIDALGGVLYFDGTASAGNARIDNNNGIINGERGATTTFAGQSGAGTATLINRSTLSSLGGGNGVTVFEGSSSAQDARIENQSGVSSLGAYTQFRQSATAGSAHITNAGSRAPGSLGGTTYFLDQAHAGNATLLMFGGAVNGASGGASEFFGTSAADATLDVRGATVAGAEGGRVRFFNGASAGHASFVVEGSQVDHIGGPEGAIVQLAFDASAGDARFAIGGNHYAFGTVGKVQINDAATAANATFLTLAGFDAGGRLSFQGSGPNVASAGNASITNGSRGAGSPGNGDDFGGATLFGASSSADHARIVNEAGATAFGASTAFRSNSTAADASIVNAGGRAADTGGITFFLDAASAGRAVIVNQPGAPNASGLTTFDNNATAASARITAAGAAVPGDIGGVVRFSSLSTAAQATLVAEGGSNGGAGGRIEFSQQANGASARVVLNAGSDAQAGGTLDLSRVDQWLTVGSVEGGGRVQLGARSLFVYGSALTVTTFSGVIEGSTPPVFPSLAVLGGTLTLSGANLYTGRTQVGDGLNPGSGKLVVANSMGSATGSGPVSVERGGTLAGSGFIAGPVTLHDGGAIVPGDPVTLTLNDSLVWNGGGVIRLVIGADDAGSDHLVVHRLIRGTAGSFEFQFIDDGAKPGVSYSLLQFDEVEGFSADDFSFSGLTGSLTLSNGTLGFSAAVPEPSIMLLLSVGVLCVGVRRRAWSDVHAKHNDAVANR